MRVNLLLCKEILDRCLTYGATKLLKRGVYIYLCNGEWSHFLAVGI